MEHRRLKQIMQHPHSLHAFIVHSLKYSPDQPRVPAGNTDGGQLASATDEDGVDDEGGVVAAAAGYSSDEALLGAGLANTASAVMSTPSDIMSAMVQSNDKYQALSRLLGNLGDRFSGDYGNSLRGGMLVSQGYSDYVSGKIGR